jgi:predicted O-methyltransferase YrrM
MSENQLIEALLTGKPYFGPAMRAMQGPTVRYRYLAALVVALSQSKRQGHIRILEIGSWAGASTITWANAVQKLGREGKITCVDQWQPYFDEGLDTTPHYRAMNEAAKDDKVLKLFLHNIRAANVSHMVDYLIGDTRKVLPKLPNAEFDIVYIDGSHVFEFVRNDIEEAKRLIRDGGIICGDDLELQRNEVDEGEHRAAVHLKKDLVYSRKANAFYHPGVTEAVAVEFGEVSNWEGVWATRKLDLQWVKMALDAAGAVQVPQHIKDASPEQHVSAKLVDSTDSFNLVKVKDRFLALAKQTGPMELFTERLGERELAPLLFLGESLEEVRGKALAFEKETAVPNAELIDEIGEYNVIKAGERFIAIAKELGPVNLLRERLGERNLPPILFVAHSIEEARCMVLGFQSSSHKVLDVYKGFNILWAGDGFFGVRQSMGPFDPNKYRGLAAAPEYQGNVVFGESVAAVQEKVDALSEV